MSVKTYHNKTARKQLTDWEVSAAEDEVALMDTDGICQS